MAVAFDAYSTATGTNPSATHTPVGTPRGVLVLLMHPSADTPTVTYGGTAVPQVARHNALLTAEWASTAVTAYLLGASVPTGAQTVAVSGTTGRLHTYTVTAADDVEYVNHALQDALATDVTVVLPIFGRTCFVAEIWGSGQGAVTAVTPLTDWTDRNEEDLGPLTRGSYSYDTIGTADVTVGVSQASDDLLMMAVAVSELGSNTPETDFALDAFSMSTALGATDPIAIHNPADIPRGVVALVLHPTADTPTVSYGGSAMTQVATYDAASLTEWAGYSFTAFVLGASVPPGPHAVVCSTLSGNGWLYVYTVTADEDVVFVASATFDATAANPSTTLAVSGHTCVVVQAWGSGQGNVNSVTPFTNWTSQQESNLSTRTAGTYSYDIVAAADVTVGVTQASDELLMMAVAVREDAGGGGGAERSYTFIVM